MRSSLEGLRECYMNPITLSQLSAQWVCVSVRGTGVAPRRRTRTRPTPGTFTINDKRWWGRPTAKEVWLCVCLCVSVCVWVCVFVREKFGSPWRRVKAGTVILSG